MRRTVLDEEASSIRDGDSIGYNHIDSSSVTFTVIFSTLVAMSGSYAFGNAVSIVNVVLAWKLSTAS